MVLMFCTFLIIGCQEISVSIEMPEPISIPTKTDTPNNEKEFKQNTATLEFFELSQPTPTLIYQTNIPEKAPSTEHDISASLLSVEDLPEEIGFIGGDQKIFNSSYLYSPGNLAGIAYVREFYTVQADLFFTEIIIISPVPITSEMMRAGYWGEAYQPVHEEMRLGDFTLACQRNDINNTYGFRFAQENIMVVLVLYGDHTYKTMPHLFSFAQQIYARLPQQSNPSLSNMPQMSFSEMDDSTYFKSIQLVECGGGNTTPEVFVNGDQGICFSADLRELTFHLKGGIYNPQYERLFYLTEFQHGLKLGESTNGLFHPVADFGWQHLPAGDYEALFWVDDELVAVLPFKFRP